MPLPYPQTHYISFNLILTAVLLILFSSTVAQATVIAGFTPGKAQKILLKQIDESQESIYIAAFSFTSKTIAKALFKAHKRGVKVAIVADKKTNEGYTAITFLANRGIPVRLNGNYQNFHHKFMIMDKQVVQTGSFNYTSSAAKKNAENIVIIEDRKVAKQFLEEWFRLWSESR